jgi:hypothetical protein
MARDDSAIDESTGFISVDHPETVPPIYEHGKPTLFVWALTFAAGISGLLFGYEYTNIAPSLLPPTDKGAALA